MIGTRDGFITILNPGLSKIIYSTYVGGNAIDNITNSIEIDYSNNLMLSGSTSSQDFPITPNALYDNFIGGDDIVLSILDKTLKIIEYSTFIGGANNDFRLRFQLIKDSLLFIWSPDFPVTKKLVDFNNNEISTLLKINLKH